MPIGVYKRKPFTEEHKKNLSISKTGDKNPMFEKYHTLKTKKIMSKKSSGDKNSMFGKHHTPETKKILSDKFSGEKSYLFGKFGRKHPSWKGDNVSIDRLHKRVRKIKLIPDICDICHKKYDKYSKTKLELSNIKNHQYTNNPDDYQYAHHSCHMKYDEIYLNFKR